MTVVVPPHAAATVPLAGMSWYFDTENWASGMWNSWAASRTDRWREAMVRLTDKTENTWGYQQAINFPRPGIFIRQNGGNQVDPKNHRRAVFDSPAAIGAMQWLHDRMHKDRTLTTHVPCADFFEIRDKALIAHATQIDPDGGWFRVPMEIQKEVWPTEEYELAKSLVDTSLPEDDLFAGIR